MPYNPDGKKVAVIGGRNFDDKPRLFDVLTKNRAIIRWIVSGGAEGADSYAVDWAKAYGVPYLVFPALWRDPQTLVFDRGAGFRRNRWIAEECDVLVAFWDGASRGTANTIGTARELGKPVRIFNFVPKPKSDISKLDLKKGLKDDKATL